MIEDNGTPMTGGRPESANGVHFQGWDAVKCKRRTLSAPGERESVNGAYFQRGSREGAARESANGAHFQHWGSEKV